MPDAAPDRTTGTSSGQTLPKAMARAPAQSPEAQPPGRSPDELRRVGPNLIDQRQQQIDPAGHHRRDANRRAGASQKQPGAKSAKSGPDRMPEDEAGDEPAEPG